MLFQFLGTAAAEGVPALFCNCDTCARSRRDGGRAVRTRSQAIIDNRLLIDFPADTYGHVLKNGIDLIGVSGCLITHRHADHLYPTDIDMLRQGYSHLPEGYHLTFCGSAAVGEFITPRISGALEKAGTCSFREVAPFEVFEVSGYTVTALPALHDKNSGPLFYDITDGEKRVLYAHDTHFFGDEVWEYLTKNPRRYDMVSLDCTNACLPLTYIGHMGLEENVKVKNRLLEIGCADSDTHFICNHFSHNGINAHYDDFVPPALAQGFSVSYDGMKVDV